MDEPVVIGVDGGGTHLRAALATVDGELLGIGEAGSGNYHDVGADRVRIHLQQAVAAAWAASGRAPRQAEAIFLGLGSIVTDEDRATIRQLVDELSIVLENRVSVDHDLRVALAGGLAGRDGIVLVAGTGSACYGRGATGATWQAGGWGPMLDDPGSSHWLGRQAMIAAIRAHDGRREPTQLFSRVLNALELDDIRQILRRVELQGMKRSEIAALACLVTEAAEQGDRVAQTIIERGVEELATMVATVAAKLDFSDSLPTVPVVVTGGLTNAGSVFMTPLTLAIKRQTPRVNVQFPMLSPVLGAVLLALESIAKPAPPSTIRRLASGCLDQPTACIPN